MTFFNNNSISLNKLELMINDPIHWEVVFRENETNKLIFVKNFQELKQFLFDKNYTIGYNFIGDWNEYFKKYTNSDETKIHYDKIIDNIEIKIIEKTNKINAEVCMWENNTPYDEDTPTRFVLMYWIKTSEGYKLTFVGKRPFDYFIKENINEIWYSLTECQYKLDELFNRGELI